jgi:hypothetical protein
MQRLCGLGRARDGLAEDDWAVEGEVERGHASELGLHAVDDRTDGLGRCLVGVPDPLDRQVEPLGGEEIEAGQSVERSLVGVDTGTGTETPVLFVARSRVGSSAATSMPASPSNCTKRSMRMMLSDPLCRWTGNEVWVDL